MGEVGETVFPVVEEHPSINRPVSEIKIDDSSHVYELPTVIQANYDRIIAAHQESHLYNQLVVRVKHWDSDDVFKLSTERSTYFNSMVTNRAMDYEFGEVTVRKLFEFGPFISTLDDSKLSNHLGFNAFVITSDDFVPFVKRGRGLSIGKGTFGDSIGASLKTKYALDKPAGEFKPEGLYRAVVKEIDDELKLSESELSGEPVILSAYRDLLEGGKPQLLILARTRLDHVTLNERFNKSTEQKARRGLPAEVELLEDGRYILWLSKEQLMQSAIAPDALYCANRRFQMLPSASASVAMLISSGVFAGC